MSRKQSVGIKNYAVYVPVDKTGLCVVPGCRSDWELRWLGQELCRKHWLALCELDENPTKRWPAWATRVNDNGHRWMARNGGNHARTGTNGPSGVRTPSAT